MDKSSYFNSLSLNNWAKLRDGQCKMPSFSLMHRTPTSLMFMNSSKRYLGNAARGPANTDIHETYCREWGFERICRCMHRYYRVATVQYICVSQRSIVAAFQRVIANHWLYCQKLFTSKALSYGSFKQRCESFRLFAFWGITGILTINLLVYPLKSTYWKQFSPMEWPAYISAMFKKSRMKSPFDWSRAEIEQTKQVWKAYNTVVKGA